MGIVSRTPTPVPLTEQDPEKLGERDLRQLVRELLLGELRLKSATREPSTKRDREGKYFLWNILILELPIYKSILSIGSFQDLKTISHRVLS